MRGRGNIPNHTTVVRFLKYVKKVNAVGIFNLVDASTDY